MSSAIVTPRRYSGRTILLWSLQLVAAIAFFAAGAAKLAGAPMMIEIFEQIGIGQWFRVVTGVVEVTGAILLLIPRLAAFGALLLAATMAGAAVTHLFVIGGSAAPAVVLLAITAFIAWLRRARTSAPNCSICASSICLFSTSARPMRGCPRRTSARSPGNASSRNSTHSWW
jgi:hypothetical protein